MLKPRRRQSQTKPSEEPEPRRKHPKFDETPPSVADRQQEVTSEEEDGHMSSYVKPISEEDSDGDPSTGLGPLQTRSQSQPRALKTLETVKSSSMSQSSPGPGSLRCGFCGRWFQFRSALEMHMRSHTGERPFTCTQCGRGFSLKGNLKTHLKTHLKTGLGLVLGLDQTRLGSDQTEPGLNGSVPGPARSWSQSRSYSGPGPFSCGVCSKSFSWRSTLAVHMRVHTGERPFTCALCDRRFSLKGNLKDHMRRHLLDKRLHCPFCDLGFNHESLLLSHIALHTGSGVGSGVTAKEEEGEHEDQSVHKDEEIYAVTIE